MTEATAVPTGGGPDPVEHAQGRRPAVIGNDSTIEIPVHLLFREDGPDVVSPRPRRAAAGPAGDTGAGSVAGRKQQLRKPVRLAVTDRPAPTGDPRLTERSAPSVPGAIAVLGGAAALAGLLRLIWLTGLVPDTLATAVGREPYPYQGVGLGAEVALTLLTALTLFAFLGLGRGRTGQVLVLSRFGHYRGTVRRTGLLWTSPLLQRRPVDVRLRHWRSEPVSAADAEGTALRVAVLVVWRVADTAKAVHAVADHEGYLSEQLEAAVARVVAQLPADAAFGGDAPTLRDTDAVGEALTRLLRASVLPVGIEVFSAQPVRIDYAPEVAGAVQRRRTAAVDALHRAAVLTSVVDEVADAVDRLTARGLVELDAAGRNTLVKDLTIAFYSARV
ncbi:SPFH domain-containing protein [Streptomyces sp. NPDC051320]|uniref:SPFH domain-containing protein n=1 Tax=Streptomyces sp. NPDC051320 TaxID=3154644 RepID=UPI00342C56C7